MIFVKQTSRQELLVFLPKSNARDNANDISLLDPNLRYLNPIRNLTFKYCKIHFNIIIPCSLKISKWSPPYGVLSENLQAILLSLLIPLSLVLLLQ